MLLAEKSLVKAGFTDKAHITMTASLGDPEVLSSLTFDDFCSFTPLHEQSLLCVL